MDEAEQRVIVATFSRTKATNLEVGVDVLTWVWSSPAARGGALTDTGEVVFRRQFLMVSCSRLTSARSACIASLRADRRQTVKIMHFLKNSHESLAG